MPPVTKADLAPYVERGLMTEVFEHVPLGTFNITAMRKIVVANPKRWPLYETDITPELLHLIAVGREVCEARIKQLTMEQLRDPAIMLKCPDGTHCMIDGHHRVVKRAKFGLKTFEFFEVPLDEAVRGPSKDDPRWINWSWGELEPDPNGGMMPRNPIPKNLRRDG